MTDDKLKPCPFCGTDVRKYSDGGDYYHPNAKIEGGDGCALNGFEFTPDEWARNRWNTRATDTQVSALIQTRDALRKLQPALNVMAREIIDDIIANQIEAALP